MIYFNYYSINNINNNFYVYAKAQPKKVSFPNFKIITFLYENENNIEVIVKIIF